MGEGAQSYRAQGFSRLQDAQADGVTLALRQTGGHVLADQTKRVCGWRVPGLGLAYASASARHSLLAWHGMAWA